MKLIKSTFYVFALLSSSLVVCSTPADQSVKPMTQSERIKELNTICVIRQLNAKAVKEQLKGTDAAKNPAPKVLLDLTTAHMHLQIDQALNQRSIALLEEIKNDFDTPDLSQLESNNGEQTQNK